MVDAEVGGVKWGEIDENDLGAFTHTNINGRYSPELLCPGDIPPPCNADDVDCKAEEEDWRRLMRRNDDSDGKQQ